jgi:protein NEDD1
MLAIATAEHLTLADPAVLRKAASSLVPACKLPGQATTSTWSPDGASLYLAFAHSINRYDAAGTFIKTVYNGHESERIIRAIIAKDKGTLIFAAGGVVHVLEHSASPSSTSKIVRSLLPQPDPNATVIALTLSNDSTLLAVASQRAVLIHNLSLGAHTVLRGLPSSGSIATCTFHPHSRVRLFLGIARDLVVYDITRPSGPLRLVPVSDAADDGIVAVACSPFSKTLLAVACAKGTVVLVDLDKLKGCVNVISFGVSSA